MTQSQVATHLSEKVGISKKQAKTALEQLTDLIVRELKREGSLRLAGLGVFREIRPEYLPAELRPQLKMVEVTRTVEIPSPKPAQFVAVLEKDGAPPAFLLSLDLERRTLMVRNVSAPAQAGKSYQLWLISSKLSSPRSLGVIGTEEYTRPQLAAYDPVLLNSATYSVSLEPEGGSRSGIPSGPMLYSGKLIQVTPIGFRDQTP